MGLHKYNTFISERIKYKESVDKLNKEWMNKVNDCLLYLLDEFDLILISMREKLIGMLIPMSILLIIIWIQKYPILI